ncbi:MAG TPA: hypothetical protein VG101_19335 [Puia sp.]|jgi:hypothetical protein|nr:hypothetical protein [Puia sp.]
MKRVLGVIIFVIVLVVGVIIGTRYFYVVGEGMKAGTLNYVVKKGYVFKTYEGEMILDGFQSKGPNTMQSNEFLFSITDTALAMKLMLSSGNHVLVRYKEYNGSVAWRGYSKFIVDSLVSISKPGSAEYPVK